MSFMVYNFGSDRVHDSPNVYVGFDCFGGSTELAEVKLSTQPTLSKDYKRLVELSRKKK